MPSRVTSVGLALRVRSAFVSTLLMLCSGCMARQALPSGSDSLPDHTRTALIKTYALQGVTINQSEYRLTYFDGIESENGFKRQEDVRHGEKIPAGTHRLG